MLGDGDGDAVAEVVGVAVGDVDDCVSVNWVCVVLCVATSVTVNP